MDDGILTGKWNQFKGKVKEQWGDLTDDDLTKVEGKRDQMVGLLQEKYGYARERAEREFDDFVGKLGKDDRGHRAA